MAYFRAIELRVVHRLEKLSIDTIIINREDNKGKELAFTSISTASWRVIL